MMVRVARVEPALFSELAFEAGRRFHRIETSQLAPIRTRAAGSAEALRRHLPIETTRPIYTL